ncbi:MAG: hypothetical protein ACYS0D_13970 [Planctomycetota bacterium]|jgi:hypothetical protein
MSGVRFNRVETRRGARIDSLRRAYFAQAAEIAIRYGVLFDRIVEHVRGAEALQPRRTPYSIRYVEDLVHAAACAGGQDLAWRDLIEQHERALVRSCTEEFDPTQAIVLVRRFLAGLQRDTLTEGDDTWSIRRYEGTRSLRRWLRDGLASWAAKAVDQPRLVLVGSSGPGPAQGPIGDRDRDEPPAETPGWTAVNAASPIPW